MLVATTIGFIVTNAVLHNCHKTALIVSSISVCFSLSGHVHSLVFAGEPLTVWTVFVLIAITIVVTELNKVHSDGFFEHVTPSLNLISLAMILIQIVVLLTNTINASINPLQQLNNQGANGIEETSPKVHDSSRRPDIYFIVPDAYPSDAWLQSAMNYDNSQFTEALIGTWFRR